MGTFDSSPFLPSLPHFYWRLSYDCCGRNYCRYSFLGGWWKKEEGMGLAWTRTKNICPRPPFSIFSCLPSSLLFPSPHQRQKWKISLAVAGPELMPPSSIFFLCSLSLSTWWENMAFHRSNPLFPQREKLFHLLSLPTKSPATELPTFLKANMPNLEGCMPGIVVECGQASKL